MQVKDIKGTFVVHLQEGDDVIQCLKKFAEENKITAATVSGIGTTSSVELGFFDKEVKQYQTVRFDEDMEMVSVTGNISVLGSEHIVHLHGVFGDDEFATFSGHVMSAKVLATGEFFVSVLDGEIKRSANSKFELNLFDLTQ